jgi:cytochrome c-type biogenesis protein CcmH
MRLLRNIAPSSLARAGQALLVAAVVGVAVAGTAATDSEARFNTLGHKMMCTCGCAQVLLECNHVGCTSSSGMRDQLASAISSGQNDSLILQNFVQQYGPTVLTAPTMKGFDIVAWIMPFAVSLLALAGTVFLVRNWAKHQPALAGNGALEPELDEMRERIRRETGEV